METALDSQSVQYSASEASEHIHLMRVELLSILSQQKPLDQGLAASIKYCEQLLESDELESAAPIRDYVALIKTLFERLAPGDNEQCASKELDALLKAVNPLAYAMQIYITQTASVEDNSVVEQLLSYPSNELRQLFSMPLVFPAFIAPQLENLSRSYHDQRSSTTKESAAQLSLLANSMLASIEQLNTLQEKSVASPETEGSSLKSVSSAKKELLRNEFGELLKQFNNVAFDVESTALSLWIDRLLDGRLDNCRYHAGLSLLSKISKLSSENANNAVAQTLVELVYFLAIDLGHTEYGSEEAPVSATKLFSEFGFLLEESTTVLTQGINPAWAEYCENRTSLSMPDLETINALTESVRDCLRSIQEQLSAGDISELTWSADNANSECAGILANIKQELETITSVIQFVPAFCCGSLGGRLQALRSTLDSLQKQPDEGLANQLADEVLALDGVFDAILHGNNQAESKYALLVQVKALLNQLGVICQRCNVEAGFDSGQSDPSDDEKKLSAICQMLAGVIIFSGDELLVDVINKVVETAGKIFITSASSTENDEQLLAADRLLESIEEVQLHLASLLASNQHTHVNLEKVLAYLSNDTIDQEVADTGAPDTDARGKKQSDASPVGAQDQEIAQENNDNASNEPTLDSSDDVACGETIVDDLNANEFELTAKNPSTPDSLGEEIDDEIAEIFIEEANEVIEELRSLQSGLSNCGALSPTDEAHWQSVKECRRYFHTLKGSGRMASATHLGEFSWAVESMLNRILERVIECEEGHVKALSEAIDYVPGLLQSFSNRQLPDPCYKSLEQKIVSLTENISGSEEPENETVSDLPVSSFEHEYVEQEHVEQESTTHERVEQEQQHDNYVPEEQTAEQIFAEELLATTCYLRSLTVPDVESDDQLQVLLKSAILKMHGLAGSAKLVEFQEASQVALIVEAHLEALLTQSCDSQTIIQLLVMYCDLLEPLSKGDGAANVVEEALEVRDNFDRQIGVELEKQSVRETIQACTLLFDVEQILNQWRVSKAEGQHYDLLVCELGMLRESRALPTSLLKLIDRLNQIYLCVEGRALNYQLHGSLLQAHEELENGLSAVLTEHEPQPLETLAMLDNLVEQLSSANNNASDTSNTDADVVAPALAAEADQVDQEILGVFLEELDELEENLSARFEEWQQSPNNASLLKAMLRPLHTLKGSARMAGLGLLATDTHSVETRAEELLECDAENKEQQLCEFKQQMGALLTQCKDAHRWQAPAEQKAPKVVERRNRDRAASESARQMLRLPASMLEKLSNLAGENNVSRSIVEQNVSEFTQGFEETDATLGRLAEQIRRLEMEAEAQIAFGRERATQEQAEGFDPLEMDRYSTLQQISRSLVESCSDLKDLHATLKEKSRSVETSLIQQSRIGRELQMTLQQTRTVPLSKVLIPRVRKTLSSLSKELDKPVALSVLQVDGELDRNVIERLTGPIEHILRNAIDHGLETEQERVKHGKSPQGLICLDIFKDGPELVIEIKDDGKGIDVEKVKEKAIKRGLLSDDVALTDDELIQTIFTPGFSTANEVTQISGRGVGLDVVSSELASMGGMVRVFSKPGEGSLFRLRLPFSVAMNRVLLVDVAKETVAVPIDSIVGVVRVSSFELEEQYHSDNPKFIYAEQEYDFHYLGKLLMGSEPEYNLEHFTALPVLLVRNRDKLAAVQVDTLIGSREITVKTLSQKFNPVAGVTGATILGDGKVVTILDLTDLIEKRQQGESKRWARDVVSTLDDSNLCKALVVDDSVTVRKVTSRLLERQEIKVFTAKDGQDALEQMETLAPDFVLLDVEMPRVDGFEVLERMRRDERLKDIPVVVISSRSGEKHQNRAKALGASAFLGKPYQDEHLLDVLTTHCSKMQSSNDSVMPLSEKVVNG